jgi:hypothetical protein
MNEFLYALIRYISNPKRMEPQNVGVLLQGDGQIEFKLNPHASKRGDIDTQVFQKWKAFLHQEVNEAAMPLFQPARSDVEFLRYLSDLCDSTVVLSPPLQLVTGKPFSEVLESLYDELVAPPESNKAAARRPAGRFRQLSDERDFIRRGMKRRMHLTRGKDRFWMAYRQVENGTLLAIDKVEVNTRLDETANEIERLPNIEHHLQRFLARRKGERPSRFVLLADQMERPFGAQSPEEFAAMREDLELAIADLQSKGAEIVRTVDATHSLANEIDAMLAAQ